MGKEAKTMMLIPRKNNYYTDLFDDFAQNLFDMRTMPETFMKTDIQETKDSYKLTIDVPGVEKEDLQIELNGGYLTVSAQRSTSVEKTDEKRGYVHRERHSGRMQRSFYVGEEVGQEDIKASHKNGTLTLTILKKDPEKVQSRKQITIE
jgi:HSP20 family protein